MGYDTKVPLFTGGKITMPLIHKPTKKSITQLDHNTGHGRSPDTLPRNFRQGPRWVTEQYHTDHKLRSTGLYHVEPLAFKTSNVSLKTGCSSGISKVQCTHEALLDGRHSKKAPEPYSKSGFYSMAECVFNFFASVRSMWWCLAYRRNWKTTSKIAK